MLDAIIFFSISCSIIFINVIITVIMQAIYFNKNKIQKQFKFFNSGDLIIFIISSVFLLISSIRGINLNIILIIIIISSLSSIFNSYEKYTIAADFDDD